MATSNAVRFLNNGTDDRELALKMYWGTVVETFQRNTVFWDNSSSIAEYKNVGPGKSWQFIVFGEDVDPEYHTPGVELLGQPFDLTEGTITVDDILVAHNDLPIDQMSMAHFDIVKKAALKHGRQLAKDFDTKMCITGLKAARHYALPGFHPGGNRVNAATTGDIATAYPANSTGAGYFYDSALNLANLLDDDNVPEEGRFMFIPPYIWRVLQYNTTLFSKDYSSYAGDLATRIITKLAGFNLVVCKNMPSTDVTSGPAKYHGDFTYDNAGGSPTLSEGWSSTIYNDGRPAALVLCGADEGRAAIGVVESMGITTAKAEDVRRNTTFIKAQMVIGCDVLFPTCAGEIYCDD